MSNTDEIRWRQRFENFKAALKQLEKACTQETYSDLERAGLVQMFEFSFELSWKTLKDLLFYEGYDVKTPREIIRKSFDVEYVDEEDFMLYIDALNKRNLLSHTYNLQHALEAEQLITTHYTPLLQRICVTLAKRSTL